MALVPKQEEILVQRRPEEGALGTPDSSYNVLRAVTLSIGTSERNPT